MLKRFIRLCSVLLTLVMLVNMLPLKAVAEEYFSASAEAAAETSVSNAQIVEEVEEHRTEFSKEFKLNNGLYETERQGTVLCPELKDEKDRGRFSVLN